MAGLGNLHREEFYLSSQMTRVAVADIGLRLTWEALQRKDWSDEQLLALQKCWDGVDFLETTEKGLEGERCMGRESVRKVQQEEPLMQKRLSSSYYGTNVLDADLLFQLRHVQGYVERVRALRAGRSWSEVSGELDRLNARIDALTNSPQRLRYVMSALTTPNFKRAVWVSVQIETERRLAITATALNRYQRKHGQLPAGLEGLVPEFLLSVPRDCMNGQALHYKPLDKQTFILYSVGEDGQDNGGDAGPAKSGGKPGLWEGRDAVWPLPGE